MTITLVLPFCRAALLARASAFTRHLLGSPQICAKRLYPEFASFVREFATLNHDVAFDNPFTERLSLRLHERLTTLE